jgi:tRNA nucleotidyltransferase (CCA-adding enzyme)
MRLDELFEILLSDKPSVLIKENEDKIFSMIPELKDCKGFDQNSKYHIYDVYEHTLHVVDNVPKKIELRLAALFHDIGKPITYFEDELGNGHFPKHWEESKRIFDDFARRYNLNNDLAKDISYLIYYHDVDFSKSDVLILDVVEKIGYDNISDLFVLKKADVLAQSSMYHYQVNDIEKLNNTLKRGI